MSLLQEPGRIYALDGAALVFDTNDQHLHELQTHTGTVTVSNRLWRMTTGDQYAKTRTALATAHAKASFIYGRCKLTWAGVNSTPLPSNRWYDIGGNIVVEHLCFRDQGGNYANYPAAMYTLLFELKDGSIDLVVESVLCNDFIAYSSGGAAYAGVTVQYAVHSAAFT